MVASEGQWLCDTSREPLQKYIFGVKKFLLYKHQLWYYPLKTQTHLLFLPNIFIPDTTLLPKINKSSLIMPDVA